MRASLIAAMATGSFLLGVACDPGSDSPDDDQVVLGGGGAPAQGVDNPGGAGTSVESGVPRIVRTPIPDDGKTPVERWGQLHVEGAVLADAQGNIVQLKGPSSMWLNWENTGYASDPAGIEYLRDEWHASVIRAAMGVDADNGYLVNPDKARADVKAIVELAVELGIYVIVDWHDHKAEEHQAEAIAFFTEIATAYGALPNLIYETYNEPLQVDWKTVVKPYHEAVVAAIRAIDPDNVIVLGTPNWSQRVDAAAADPVGGSNLMYTLHFYSCSHKATLRNQVDAAVAKGTPVFVTEWGATNADGGTTGALCLDEAQSWHNWMNNNAISWAAWKLDNCGDLSCYFKSGTPTGGNWTDEQLNGHGPFVRDRMKE